MSTFEQQKTPENDPVQRQTLRDFLDIGRRLVSGGPITNGQRYKNFDVVTGDDTLQFQVRVAIEDNNIDAPLLEIILRNGVPELMPEMKIYSIEDEFSPVEKRVLNMRYIESTTVSHVYAPEVEPLVIAPTNTEILGLITLLKALAPTPPESSRVER